MNSPTIRVAREDELGRLREIEDEAEVLFADTGLIDGLIEGPDHRESRVTKALLDGRIFVATELDEAIGFALVDVYDTFAHLEELDVHPDHGRKGIGRALVEHVIAWSKERGYEAVTLATFRDVPWNAPFYASCGFSILAEHEYPLHAQMVHKNEVAIGFDMAKRVIMRHPLTAD